MSRQAFTMFAVAILLAGCSSTPRPFTPHVASADAAAAADAAASEAVVNRCKVLVAEGRRSDFATAAVSTGAGMAAGYGTMAAAAPALIYASQAAAVTMLGAATGIGVLAAYGVSRAARSNKEREIKQATETCLAEHGYTVTRWEQVRPVATR